MRVVLELLSKAAKTERDGSPNLSSLLVKSSKKSALSDTSPIRGLLPDVLEISKDLPNEISLPLANFFSDVELEDLPVYGNKRDSFSVTLKLRSLLPDDLPLDSAKLRMVGSTGGQTREIWLESKRGIRLRPGQGEIQFHSNVGVSPRHWIEKATLTNSRQSSLASMRSTGSGLLVAIFASISNATYLSPRARRHPSSAVPTSHYTSEWAPSTYTWGCQSTSSWTRLTVWSSSS